MAVRSLSHAITLPQSDHGFPFYQPATHSTLFGIGNVALIFLSLRAPNKSFNRSKWAFRSFGCCISWSTGATIDGNDGHEERKLEARAPAALVAHGMAVGNRPSIKRMSAEHLDCGQ